MGSVKERTIILASQSPRRRELLTLAGLEYKVEPSQIAEQMADEKPWELVKGLSRQKAEDIYTKHSKEDILIIGADTVVAFQDKILGKPHSGEEAFQMLQMLQGQTHQVYTGVTLLWNTPEGKNLHTFSEKTEVAFYPMSEQEIWEYIQTGDCMDKAGAYGIQTCFCIHIKEICGDYNNVVGLPIARLYQEMKAYKLL